jgi:hypothetical protein
MFGAKALALASAVLMFGTAQLAMAQSADDDLRLETDAAAEDPAVAVPQPIPIGDDVPERPRRAVTAEDPYAAPGLRSGAFLLFPAIETSAVVASNPRNATSGANADIGITVRPSLRLESNWVRHSLTADASLEAEQFIENADIKSLAGDVGGEFRLDIRRTTTATFGLNYAATSTGLESDELPTTATGNRLDQVLDANAAVTHDFGGLEGRLRLGVSRNLFGDVELTGGGEENNSDRDYTELSIAARAALRTGGLLEPFLEAAYEPRIHDRQQDRNGLKRDSQGLRLSLGVTVNDDPVWTGDVAATLALRDYSDKSLDTVLAPGFAANLTWRPTDLTQFEFNAGASLSETVAADVSAQQNWSFGVTAAHALRDNVSLRAGASLLFERAGGETDVTSVGSVGVDWTLNPFVVLSAGYEGTFFTGAGAGDDYADHRLLTSIILRR